MHLLNWTPHIISKRNNIFKIYLNQLNAYVLYSFFKNKLVALSIFIKHRIKKESKIKGKKYVPGEIRTHMLQLENSSGEHLISAPAVYYLRSYIHTQ